jgi:hypothetical protein
LFRSKGIWYNSYNKGCPKRQPLFILFAGGIGYGLKKARDERRKNKAVNMKESSM